MTSFCLRYASYVDERGLYSFPTRRSSDLRRSFIRWKTSVADRVGGRRRSAVWLLPGRADHDSGGVARDRKSTRLNSSHSQISYAVFCLKKKNRQHLPTHKSSSAASFHAMC